MAHALHAWLPALCTGPLTRGGRLGLGLGLGLANPSPSPNPYQAFKEELTQTALYIVDEVEARLKAHKEDWMGRLQAQQVVLEGSLQAQTELQAALEGSLTALDAYLEGLRPHEALLQRDEVAYVKQFAEEGHSAEGEEPLSLAQIQAKVAEQRAEQERVRRTLANEVIIGMYQVALMPPLDLSHLP